MPMGTAVVLSRKRLATPPAARYFKGQSALCSRRALRDTANRGMSLDLALSDAAMWRSTYADTQSPQPEWASPGSISLWLGLLLPIIAVWFRLVVVVLVCGTYRVVAQAPSGVVVHKLLQVIVDRIVVQGLLLPQQMPDHLDLWYGGLAVALRLSTRDELLDQRDTVFVCAILFELVAYCDQLIVYIHPPLLPAPLTSRRALREERGAI